MATTRINKFRDIAELQYFLNGGITGAPVSAGIVGLVGKSLTFKAPGPVGTVTFTGGSGSDPSLLRLADIKSQIEAAVAGLLVSSVNGRIAIAEATPTNGVVVASGSTGGHGKVIGTVDLNTLTYGVGGTVDTKTFILNIDGLGNQTTTFVAPANRAAIVSQINAVITTRGTASIDGNNHLVVASATTGGTSSVVVGNGTADANLGFTNGESNTGAATDEANGPMGFDSSVDTISYVYAPPTANTTPRWTWVYSVNENLHVLFVLS